MRRAAILVSCLVLGVFPCGRSAAVADDDVDLAAVVREAKLREAALRSVTAALAVLQEDLAPAAALAERMLADPAAFAEADAARARLAGAERDELRAAFRDQLESFARGRADALPRDWVDTVLRDESVRVEATIDDIVGDGFPARFAEGRAAAVATQRERVRPLLYPPAAQLLALAGDPATFAAAPHGHAAAVAGGDAAQAQAKQAAAAVRASTPLFAELDAGLDSAAAAAVAAGLDDLWRQLGVVERPAPSAAVRAADIAAALRADLDAVARASDLPYGVFPEVASRLDSRSEALERERLADYIGAQLSPKNGCSALPPDDVAVAAGADAAAVPPTFAAHADALRTQLEPATRERIVAGHAAAVAEGGRAAFAAHVGKLLDDDEELQRRWSGAFAACLEPPLRDRRRQLAAAELRAAQPEVADLSFAIPDDDIATLAVADEEFDAGLFPPAAGLRLEETQELFRERAGALQREARAAVRLQELLTRAPERRSRFVREVEADRDRTAERRRHYQRAYEKEVLEVWNERRGRILLRDASGATLHPGKYARIFPTTSGIIDEIITTEFERPAPTATPVASPPPSPPPTRARPTPPPTRSTPLPTVPRDRSGPLPTPANAGLPQPARKPVPLPQTGGAPKTGPGAGSDRPKSCEERLQSSLQALGLCHDALVACRDDPATCAQGLAACGQARFACEQTR